jgi:hypothetical protein
MTPKEAEKKYGKENLKKMQKHLDGITISIDSKTGEEDIPERDLEMAYDMITKGWSNISWD